MWKQILAAALSAVTAAIEAVTAAIEAGNADQYNCITAQNTADVPLLYGKGTYPLKYPPKWTMTYLLYSWSNTTIYII